MLVRACRLLKGDLPGQFTEFVANPVLSEVSADVSIIASIGGGELGKVLYPAAGLLLGNRV